MHRLKYFTNITPIVLFIIASGCSKDGTKSNDTPKNISSDINTIAVIYQEINDSGITWAGNYTKDNIDTCNDRFEVDSAEPKSKIHLPIQQDCSFGRDITNKDSDGRAGFSYQKINNQGIPLPDNSSSGNCVLDTVTGLLWEVKTEIDGIYGNSGLHDGDDLFTWYSNNSSVNGGAVGSWNNVLNICSGYIPNEPKTFCNTEEFIQRVNNVGLCGFKDWRLPTRFEIESLVDYGTKGPSIDTTYFPNTKLEFYWSSTPAVNAPFSAWAVNFRSSNTSLVSRESSFPVRLVRDWVSKQ
ncbi:DUF1566 domain-containing protein [Cellvibrio sp. UBA7671]|uniref:Lcl C-terminal domain-containing protein n=1 Tax=Cellvibrio sp. UBA7671 TaxID=1946312 RepID=UPI002F360242